MAALGLRRGDRRRARRARRDWRGCSRKARARHARRAGRSAGVRRRDPPRRSRSRRGTGTAGARLAGAAALLQEADAAGSRAAPPRRRAPGAPRLARGDTGRRPRGGAAGRRASWRGSSQLELHAKHEGVRRGAPPPVRRRRWRAPRTGRARVLGAHREPGSRRARRGLLAAPPARRALRGEARAAGGRMELDAEELLGGEPAPELDARRGGGALRLASGCWPSSWRAPRGAS